MIRYDLEDFDFIEYQVDRIQKDFPEQLELEVYARQAEMLDILKEMVYTASLKKDEDLLLRIDAMINSAPAGEMADQDVLDYNGWLSEKIK